MAKKLHKKRSLMILIYVFIILAPFSIINTSLAGLNVDTSQISVVGLSSGAAMATQMHVAFSKTFMGAGIVAGVPYYCAEEDGVLEVTLRCVEGIPLPDALHLVHKTHYSKHF